MAFRIKKVKAEQPRGVSGRCLVSFSGKTTTFSAVKLPEEVRIAYSDSCVLAHEFGHVLLTICLKSCGHEKYLFREGLKSAFLKAHEILAWSIARSLSPAYDERKAIHCLNTHSYAFMKAEIAYSWLSKPLNLTKEEIVSRFFEVGRSF